MKKNLLKDLLITGQAARGVWLGIPSPFSARLLARLPLDWLVIDEEHSPLNPETLALMVAAIADANGPAPLVRLAQASVENIKKALDAGASGIIAPMINTPAEAEQVVAWARFPPQGLRSFGSAYAGLAWDQSMAEFLQNANEQTIVGIQIESEIALENIDAIFNVKGIDLAFIGPIDLSISLGENPFAAAPSSSLERAINIILSAAKPHRLPLGIFCANGKIADERLRQGFQFVNVTSDTGGLLRHVQAELDASK
jgi:4-hydroxy-2-oxoheptanedioate aldolase